MRNIAPYTPGTLDDVRAAIVHIKAAIQHLSKAGSPKAATAAGRALTSAEGAERHAQRRRLAAQSVPTDGGVR